MSKDVAISVRISGAEADRLDALRSLLAPSPGCPLSRSDVIRAAVDGGLATLEARAAALTAAQQAPR